MGKKKQVIKKENTKSEKEIYFGVFAEEMRRIDAAGIDDFVAQSLKRLWYYVTIHKFDISANAKKWNQYDTSIHFLAHSEPRWTDEEFHQKMTKLDNEIEDLSQGVMEFQKKYHDIKIHFPERNVS